MNYESLLKTAEANIALSAENPRDYSSTNYWWSQFSDGNHIALFEEALSNGIQNIETSENTSLWFVPIECPYAESALWLGCESPDEYDALYQAGEATVDFPNVGYNSVAMQFTFYHLSTEQAEFLQAEFGDALTLGKPRLQSYSGSIGYYTATNAYLPLIDMLSFINNNY